VVWWIDAPGYGPDFKESAYFHEGEEPQFRSHLEYVTGNRNPPHHLVGHWDLSDAARAGEMREALEFYANAREFDDGTRPRCPDGDEYLGYVDGGNCCDGVYGHEEPKTKEERRLYGGPNWVADNGERARKALGVEDEQAEG